MELTVTIFILISILVLVHPVQVLAHDDGHTNLRLTVECLLEEKDLTYLSFDAESQMWRQPMPDQENNLPSTLPVLPVKECRCAHAVGRTGEFCLAEFDTCFVPGKEGPVICSTNTAKINISRGAWPFCLFLLTIILYLCSASEGGWRARGYIRRQWGNGTAYIREKQQQLHSISFSRRQSDDDGGAPQQEAAFHADEESGIWTSDTPNTSDNNTSSLRTDTGRQPADETTTAIAQVVTQVQDHPPTGSQSHTNDADNHVVAPVSTSSLWYPPQFGSRSNYTQLLNEIHDMHLYQPDRLILLWDSIRLQERRARFTGARRERLRNIVWNAISTTTSTTPGTTTGRSREDSPTDHRQHPNPPWSEKRSTTIQLRLKTKRFPSGTENTEEEEEEKDDESDNVSAIVVGSERDFQTTESQAEEYDDDELNEHTCVICLSELDAGELVGDIPCGHYFHKECLKSWLMRSNRCPLCQQENIVTVERIPGPALEHVLESEESETSSS